MKSDYDGVNVPCLCISETKFDPERNNVVNGFDLWDVRILNGVVMIPFNYYEHAVRNKYCGAWVSMISEEVFRELEMWCKDDAMGDP